MELKNDRIQTKLFSEFLELSDVDAYKPYLTFTNRVCYYDEPNGNGVALPYDDNAESYAQTLVNQPIVAKYCVDDDGQPNLRDHCVSKDSDGNYRFNTESVGTVTKVWIEENDVHTFAGEQKKLKCLYAEGRIWKRHKNYVDAIHRLFSEGNLHNSWEISSSSYHLSDAGVKVLDEYVFEANCFLGTVNGITPAYGDSAEVLDLATTQEDVELLVASLLSEDIKNLANGVENMEDMNVATQTEELTDVSALTVGDLYEKIQIALRGKDFGGHIWLLFPEEHIVWAREWDAPETKYVKFTYEVNGDDVALGDFVDVELEVSPIVASEELSARDEKIAALEHANEELQATVDELSAYKKVKEAEEEARRAELLNKERENLRSYVEKSGVFTEDEISAEEIASLIENVETNKLKAMIADRLLERASLQVPNTPSVTVDVSSMMRENALSDDGVAVVRKYIRS